MEELFRDYWWLIFPIFGMAWAVWDMASSDRRQRDAMEALRFYAQQGKDPPPELIRLALRDEEGLGLHGEFAIGEAGAKGLGPKRGDSRVWRLIVFAALAAGFGAGWWWVRAEDFAFALLIVTVTMAVLALGALALLVFDRKS